METIGQKEWDTQRKVVELFEKHLGYSYRGNRRYEDNPNIEKEVLGNWLIKQGVNLLLVKNTWQELDKTTAIGGGKNLYYANKAFYSLLRYGVKVKEGTGEQYKTVWLINWKEPEKNDFAIAEEVTVSGKNDKRPDIVLYINGIALGVLELKRSNVWVSKGIRQNLNNQKEAFIRSFFTTMQLLMAGNESEGLRYGTIETKEKYYLSWKEDGEESLGGPLYSHLALLCNKPRLLEILHDFIVFDSGIKKVTRHNQYFGVKTAQERIRRREGGIIWHTQGSGKTLTMVWLAKWIRENVDNSRVLILTDRTELDGQIEGVFTGVDEHITRIKNKNVKNISYSSGGEALIKTLAAGEEWLMCALIHKFNTDKEDEVDQLREEMQQAAAGELHIPGDMFVFVDECHRTQSGKLHEAMKAIMPNAMYIGFTGTPLLKADKKKSIEVFGPFIHTYKYDEAVKDGMVVDLLYEARDIDQYINAQDKIDRWFEAKTSGLSDMAKVQLKQKWGTMQKVLSSQSRLEMIVSDILLDMETRPRLMGLSGNAILVCSSIYQACKCYELFSSKDLAGKCAIITSYRPSPADIKDEESGEGLTEKLRQYEIYCKMLADHFDEPQDKAMYKTEKFEEQVKERFVKEPGQMRLLIVVDKLLTGFDAPPATYLYIDKQMRDHGLFQAICRVNRIDGEDKEYGYIIDYKDLFKNLEGAINDYTGAAFDGYDKKDVQGLLTNRLERGRERLEEMREAVKALCEPVPPPKDDPAYLHYFCSADTKDKNALRENEPKRVSLYKLVAALLRAYTNLANEMEAAGYSEQEFQQIKQEVTDYSNIRDKVISASGDRVDMKLYEPAMRHLLDTYIRAQESRKVSFFDDLGLIDLIAVKGLSALDNLPEGIHDNPEAVAETIENNLRRIIIDEHPINPKYYEKMSELLDALIEERRENALDYQDYLKKIEDLSVQAVNPATASKYPPQIDSKGKQALYDNLNHDLELTLSIDKAVRESKKDDWRGNNNKEKLIKNAIRAELVEPDDNLGDIIFGIIKAQRDDY